MQGLAQTTTLILFPAIGPNLSCIPPTLIHQVRELLGTSFILRNQLQEHVAGNEIWQPNDFSREFGSTTSRSCDLSLASSRISCTLTGELVASQPQGTGPGTRGTRGAGAPKRIATQRHGSPTVASSAQLGGGGTLTGCGGHAWRSADLTPSSTWGRCFGEKGRETNKKAICTNPKKEAKRKTSPNKAPQSANYHQAPQAIVPPAFRLVFLSKGERNQNPAPSHFPRSQNVSPAGGARNGRLQLEILEAPDERSLPSGRVPIMAFIWPWVKRQIG